MGLTAAAEWLNGFFNNFDSAILTFYHGAAGTMGNFLTPLMVFISYFGAKGIFSIILSLILMLFSRTRKAGFCALLAVGIGAILCNVILKPQIARPRPYTVSPYDEWWKDVGAHAEKDMSFPSGHVNVITATLAGIFLVSKKKKYTWTLLFGVILMAASRNYLMVHYPSDVMFGMITGFISAALSFVIIYFVYRAIEKRKENSLAKWVLEADLIKFVTSRRGRS